MRFEMPSCSQSQPYCTKQPGRPRSSHLHRRLGLSSEFERYASISVGSLNYRYGAISAFPDAVSPFEPSPYALLVLWPLAFSPQLRWCRYPSFIVTRSRPASSTELRPSSSPIRLHQPLPSHELVARQYRLQSKQPSDTRLVAMLGPSLAPITATPRFLWHVPRTESSVVSMARFR